MPNFRNVILPVSLLANAILGYWYFRPPPPAPAPQAATKSPEVHVSVDGFDFSRTGLSDEAWKVPPADLTPAGELPKTPEPPDLDSLRLLPKP